MARALSVVVLLAVAALAASGFGALHNLVSYAVGPDYFHAFKFEQFATPETWPPRLAAAWIGVLASWWMGPVVGLPGFLVAAFRQPDAAALRRRGVQAIAAVMALASLSAALGLATADTGQGARLLELLPDVTDPEGFLRAGAMHNASYLGGTLGLPVAMLIGWRRPRA